MLESPLPNVTRTLGIDAGAETIKVVLCDQRPGEAPEIVWRDLREHHKDPAGTITEMLRGLDWDAVSHAASTGRLGRLLALPRIPVKQAQVAAFNLRYPTLESGTVVSIGSHGFSVLEIRDEAVQIFRENSRCSQGTGNFLRQLVERFSLSLEEASALAHHVDQPAPLSGRCPVILKTDMTHLANKGEDRARILAGLYDAVCENVEVLIKPKLAPKDVVLVGGVTRAPRVQEQFARYLEENDMTLQEGSLEDALFFEAMGAAVLAAEQVATKPALDAVLAPPEQVHMDRVPTLASSLPRVHRMKAPPVPQDDGQVRDVLLGFDIGSTGSKALAVDRDSKEILWEGYINTNGNPVVAAKELMAQYARSPMRTHNLRAVAATGSGREIVGSLLSVCYGPERVYVLNEIAAHAEGALHYDSKVDTIFEIGGQDAKYIRLFDGRVSDAAMNEACSAGTGSFIEEQGKRFQGVRDIVHLGQVALTAQDGISLGQHCSVFMAEVIDEAVAAGAAQPSIIAGIYDSIIQNYLNRVKGSRDVGQRVFCQGMPFSADALAAAVARQTGSEVIIPPNPGTVGALGIALLARRHLSLPADAAALSPDPFLEAEVIQKDTFICKSKKGCGGAGNHCRIDRLTTRVMGQKKRFLWGGSCSRYDRGTNKVKLPDRSPDPFRERDVLVDQIVARTSDLRGRPTIGLTDEFTLKPLYPFFATFLYEMGFDLLHQRGADQAILKRGIEEANVPFCAPMQQYHGLVSTLADKRPDYLFLPMVRSLPRVKDETYAVLCPIVQGSPDIMRLDLGERLQSTLLSPVFDVGPDNLESEMFRRSCARLADDLGVDEATWLPAFSRARQEQHDFDETLLDLGRQSLAFCAEHDVTPVVVLGRAYTIYNTVLNSNVPALLREQGALPIPVDCYPIEDAPTFNDLYWGYAQRSLRAAHQIRRTPGQYSVYCSNYSCGPDSFNLHFFSYVMDGRPFSIIETDGHSGDAGTKTRIEAFLHCVREEQEANGESKPPQSFAAIDQDKETLAQVKQRRELMLIPNMGPGAAVLAAAFEGVGIRAEALPMPDAEALELGRRQTSGKECVPMTITAGSLIQRLQQEKNPDARFSFFMPTANGPCRFGVYNLLHKIIIERLGYKDRVKIFSASDDDYFSEVPAGFQVLVWAGFLAMDLILEAHYHTRPAETLPGASQAIFDRYSQALVEHMRQVSRGDISLTRSLGEVASGRLFGLAKLVSSAAESYAAVCDHDLSLPSVLVVGEIYVRSDPFANGFVIDKLEARGVRARFAPFNEWLEYSDWLGHLRDREGWPAEDYQKVKAHITTWVQTHVQDRMYGLMAKPLGWPPRTTVQDSITASTPYLREALTGEAVLTLGGPIHEHQEGHIDAVISVGPLECMPNKLSESQFFHVAERQGLLSLTLPLNGDPFDIEVLENFIYEVKKRHQRRLTKGEAHKVAQAAGPRSLWGTMTDRAQRASSTLTKGLVQLGATGTLLEALTPTLPRRPFASFRLPRTFQNPSRRSDRR